MTSASDPTQSRSAAMVVSSTDQVVTVLLTGELDQGAVTAVNAAFAQAMSVAATVVVVDATAVSFCAFEGAGALLLFSLRCRDLGRELRLLPSRSVQRKLLTLGVASLDPLTPVN